MESAADNGAVLKPRTKSAKDFESAGILLQKAGYPKMRELRRSRSYGDGDAEKLSIEVTASEELSRFDILRKCGPLNKFEYVELLHLAAAGGRDNQMRLLLDRMPKDPEKNSSLLNARIKSWPLWTALHQGADKNFEGILKLLLTCQGIEVDATDSRGNTALLIASERGHTAAVKILLKAGATIPVWNTKGMSCLSSAVSQGHVDVVKTLIDFLEEHQGLTVNGLDVEDGFQFIQSKDNTSPKWTSLHHASAHSHAEVLKVLLENPHIGTVDAQDEYGSTALILASERGHEGIVQVLLESKADPVLVNLKGWNCLHAAAFAGHDQVLNALLNDHRSHQGMNAQDTNGNTALMLASSKGHKRAVEILMLSSADVRVINLEGSTCLHMAADGGHSAIIQSISRLIMHMPLETRIDLIDAQGVVSGNTALTIVSEKGDEEAVRALLSAGASPLICNKDQYSCIHVAAKLGHYAVLEMILGESEDDQLSYEALESESLGPELPLPVLSTSKTRPREVALLKMMGQRVSTNGLAGLTALHLAAQGLHLKIILLLLKAYLALVLKVHGFTHHPRDQPLVRKFLLLLSNRVSDRYKNPSGRIFQVHVKTSAPSNAEPKKSQKRVYDSVIKDLISKTVGHDEIRNALMQNWMSLESSQGAGDWKKVILENFYVIPGGEEYFVEKFVDAYMKLVDYSNSKDSSGRTFLHYLADQRLPVAHERESCSQEGCLLRRVLGIVSVDVNSSDSKRDTPLHLAMRRGNRCVFRHCLVPGRVLHLDTKNDEGISVLDLAFGNASLEFEGSGSIKLGPNLDPFKELESVLIERLIATTSAAPAAESGQDTYTSKILLETLCLFLKSMTNRFSNRRVAQISSQDHEKLIEAFQEDYHYGGLTLLHYIAFRGLSNDLQFLLKLKSSAFSRLVNRPCEINKWAPLHYAVHGGHKEVVEVLLNQESEARTNEKDKSGQTPLGIAITRKAEFKEKHSTFHVFKYIEQLLLKDSEVSAYNEKLRSDRQVLGDASNAILVGASVIASVTFAGWLQPPLGYVDYHLFPDSGPPPGSTESFAAIAHYPAVQVFWVFNSLSFFFAVATVICGAGAVVQATSASSYYIRKEVRLMRLWLRMTSTLLAISIMCVLGAFAAAGFAVLPPSTKYRTSMIVTASLGIPTCVICLLCLFTFSRVLRVGPERSSDSSQISQPKNAPLPSN